jgi:hypothetical protein
MINRDVYETDPGQNRLLNQGVAKVTSGHTDPELETLRFEVANFVCDGHQPRWVPARVSKNRRNEPSPNPPHSSCNENRRNEPSDSRHPSGSRTENPAHVPSAKR